MTPRRMAENAVTARTCPVFLCYRHADAREHARWIYGCLQGAHVTLDGERRTLEIYFDQAAPAVGDWHAVHGVHLERAKAMIVVVTPGLRSDFRSEGESDWVQHELDWWVRHRTAAPIVFDTTGDERFVPPQLRRRWPNVQRIETDLNELSRLPDAERSDRQRMIVQRVLEGIEQSQATVVAQDVARLRGLVRGLHVALWVAVVLFATAGSLAWLAWATAGQAQAERSRADLERRAVLRLASFRELRDLREAARGLWPLDDLDENAVEDWLERADRLVATLEADPDGGPGHLAVRERLRRRVAELDERDERADLETRWWLDQLDLLIDEVEAFRDPERGLVRGTSTDHGWGVASRIRRARDLTRRSLESDAAVAVWRRARTEIRTHPAYGGLDLSPQFGLLPLGPDPRSTLWEFAELSTGSAPSRDQSGELVIGADCGIVFVLVSGGRFTMGTHDDAGSALLERDELPPHEVELAPFFLSKFEVTQHQWLALTGENPSTANPDNEHPRVQRMFSITPYSPRYPVEGVTWHDCKLVLERVGLALPTEAQWEYAARAGSGTHWWTGDTLESISGHENLAGRSSVELLRAMGQYFRHCDVVDDPFPLNGPVGALSPNPFGLFDVHGGVMEWCEDAVAPYETKPRAGDGLRSAAAGGHRVFRGGSFMFAPAASRATNRRSGGPDSKDDDLGVRPARSITRWSGGR